MEISASSDRVMIITAQTDLRSYAEQAWPRLNHKGRLRELARKLPLGPRRVRAIYNAETGVSIRAAEVADIATLTGEATNAVRASQNEYRALEARLAALEALFAAVDEEHGRPHMDALRDQARRQGGAPQGVVE